MWNFLAIAIMLNGMQNSMVLYRRTYDVVATKIAYGSGNGGIVTFGSAAGKKDGAGFHPKDLCHAFPCVFNGEPCLSSVRINGGRIAKMIGHVRKHGFQHFFVQRRCGGIVEIDPLILFFQEAVLRLAMLNRLLHVTIV
jgi:hypothetical protein